LGAYNLSTVPIMKPDCIQSCVAFPKVGLLAFIVAGLVGSALVQTSQAATKLPSGEPCSVVSLSDVLKVFPGAKAGERSTQKEKYGLTECNWKDGSGVVVLVVQEFYGSDSAMVEAKGAAIGYVDGSNAGAARNMRYEVLSAVGLGNEAVAFVEASDAKRGIVSSGAMLVLHRGQRTLFLTSPRLQERDRAAALKALGDLGRIAAKRLD
jgi:hypothetical protein